MFDDSRPSNRTTVQRHVELQERVAARRTPRSPHARRRPSRAVRITLRLLVTLVLLLLIGAIGSLIALNRAYSGRIIPNVAVQGIWLDQMQPDAARELLRRHYAAFLATPVVFMFEGRTWRPTAAEIGLSLDIEAAVDRAYAVGRGADLYRSLPDAVNAWQDGVELPLCQATISYRTRMASRMILP
jgi:hypothetical protein